MKKTILIIICTILFYCTVRSQKEYASFYVDGIKHACLTSVLDRGYGDIFFDMGNEVYVLFTPEERVKFIQFLNYTWHKYEVLGKRASLSGLKNCTNNIKSYDKNSGVIFKQGNWRYTRKKRILRGMFHMFKGEPTFIIEVTRASSRKVPSINNEPQYLFIQDRRELDNIIRCLEDKTIENFLAELE